MENLVSDSHSQEEDCHKRPLCRLEHNVVTGETANTPQDKLHVIITIMYVCNVLKE